MFRWRSSIRGLHVSTFERIVFWRAFQRSRADGRAAQAEPSLSRPPAFFRSLFGHELGLSSFIPDRTSFSSPHRSLTLRWREADSSRVVTRPISSDPATCRRQVVLRDLRVTAPSRSDSPECHDGVGFGDLRSRCGLIRRGVVDQPAAPFFIGLALRPGSRNDQNGYREGDPPEARALRDQVDGVRVGRCQSSDIATLFL